MTVVYPRDLSQRGRAKRRRERTAGVSLDRWLIARRDGWVCGICSEHVSPDEMWSIDHIVPLARGGSHSYENVQLAHFDCNTKKGFR